MRLALILYGAVYTGLLVLFQFAIAKGNTGPVWGLWVLCGVITLSATAMELTLLLIWSFLRARGILLEDPYVPEKLADDDRRELAERSPPAAILVPAHREAATPEDATALRKRIVDILIATPSWSTLFLLFDSPDDQETNEIRVIDQIKASLRTAGR
ncbi:MAG: hypothetical protein ACC655_09855, partial [Rhodothermia bacterium]